ncbi:PAS domain S-box protein [Paraburkholderia sp. MMS20-SJTR3]|uniref:histidine kinase n=1 Tax=Paraburkholderia sejongensis TaxID=2886946 RepID=A0ABS8JR40_9BURK|nr:PAS domain S-box protein [Paraburkholderia sp. MMS20-SJTR3]MCC8392220.1 PAS domain S-box protein [Paraburkholderia sp. MMS20-SJTR3]
MMTPARILIVEDDRIVARDIAQQMTRVGHTVVGTTTRGEDALVLARDTQPELVLMDVRLEGELDGIDAARLLRDQFDLAVVFLTAYADEDTVRRATTAEPFGYVLKPFDDNQLRTMVEMALYKHGAERRLRASEERYAVTLSSIGEGVIATDADGRIDFINPVAQALTGWRRAEALGRSLGDVFRLIDDPAGDPALHRRLLVARDGGRVPVESNGSPIVDDQREVIGVVLVFRDVTERRRAEEAEVLREINARFETAMCGSNVGVWAIDMPDGDFRRGTARFANVWEWLGYTGKAPLLDYDAYMSVVHPDERAATEEAMQRFLAQPDGVFEIENRLLHHDGSDRKVLVRGTARCDASGKPVHFIGSVVDITQLKHAEQELRVSEERFRGTFENAAVGIAHCDLAGRFLRVNQRACEIVGYERDALLERRLQDLTHGDFCAALLRRFGVPSEAGASHFSEDQVLVRRDGMRVWANLSVALQFDEAGHTSHIIAIIQDISARKALEDAVRVAKDAAEAANQAKDQFLANISHELRTPLNGILGYAQILRRDAGLDARQLASLGVIEQSGEHLLLLINDLLDFARIGAGKLELQVRDVPLAPFLDVIAEIVRVRAQEKGLVLHYRAAPDLPNAISVDEKRLRQVLLNLLANAVKFTDHGEVTLAVTPVRPGRLRFEVTDSGIGISADRRDAIFEPFEQAGELTRRSGGAGLGLAISRQLVRMMGDDLRVASSLGAGSAFWFELDAPTVPAPAAPVAAPLRIAPEPAGRFVVPPPHEMAQLHRFALLGSMRDIVERAQHLVALDSRYEGFAARLRALAAAYESQALLALIEAHLVQGSQA